MPWMTRGVRQQHCVDIWITRARPVLVRGNWKHPSAPTEPKRHWLPWCTVPLESLQIPAPKTGECITFRTGDPASEQNATAGDPPEERPDCPRKMARQRAKSNR